MSEEQKIREGWAIVEVMGHVTIAGYVTETTFAGAGIVAVAVPDGDRMVEQLVSPTSLYRLTWVGEAEARQVAQKHPVWPIDEWTIRTEIREKMAAEERESIEVRIRRDVEREFGTRAREERERLLDVLSLAKALGSAVHGSVTDVGRASVTDVMAADAGALVTAIDTYAAETYQRIGEPTGGRVAIHHDDRDDWDDDDDGPPL